MSATLRHFAINASDVERAKRFYEHALGLRFAPYGPPGFYQIHDVGQGVRGALQERREIAPGKVPCTFETTFGVEDLGSALEAIASAGGRVVMPPFRIEGVGDLAYFEDTEGNLCGVMQYLSGVWDR